MRPKEKKGLKYEPKIYADMPAPALSAQRADFTLNLADSYRCIATFLESRFKELYFDTEKKQHAWEMIQAELEVMNTFAEGSTHSTEQSVPEKWVRTDDDELIKFQKV